MLLARSARRSATVSYRAPHPGTCALCSTCCALFELVRLCPLRPFHGACGLRLSVEKAMERREGAGSRCSAQVFCWQTRLLCWRCLCGLLL